MRLLSSVGFLNLALVAITTHASLSLPKEVKILEQISSDCNNFSSLLVKSVAELGPKDFESYGISPIGIYLTLSTIAFGATGETRSVLDSAVYNGPEDERKISFKSLVDYLNHDLSGLRVTNGFFASRHISFESKFVGAIDEVFGATLRKVDFEKEPIATNDIMSDWCKERTNSRLKNSVTAANYDPKRVLSFTNTVYLKGTWLTQFNIRETENKLFFVNTTVQTYLPHMIVAGNITLVEKTDFTIFELPLRADLGGRQALRMIVILPKELKRLPELEQNISGFLSQHLFLKSSLVVEERCIVIPKFRIASKIDLTRPLKNMSMGDLFSKERARFLGISSPRDRFYFTGVEQNTVFEMNEEGIEVASAIGCNDEILKAPSIFKPDSSLKASKWHEECKHHRIVVRHPFYAAIVTSDLNPVNLFTVQFNG
ncbi:serpin B11-like [Venturia canescens]|uniref:serpin B11-like n=1 Tax=Venturia canescens TaxID=32260 RepID=UPI001C9C6D42|nr:serpin B11-like [Venturia canescens]